MNTVLLTGTNGFVGRKLTPVLLHKGYNVRTVLRDRNTSSLSGCEVCCIKTLDRTTSWCRYLNDVDSVIHLAARVHQMQKTTDFCLAEFRKVNVEGTLNLAQQASEHGVKRFIFLSSVKVNGEATTGRSPFTETDTPAPVGPYANSKWDAEQGLLTLAQRTGMEVVIIRPALVYGPGVKANFLRLLRLVDSGLPLPFGSIKNMRSYLYLDNLVDFILHCLVHPDAANQIFLAADGEDMSTSELLRRLSAAMGKIPRLLPVPQKALELSFALAGRKDIVFRLCGSLQVDIRKARQLLRWRPPFSVNHGLEQTVMAYQKKRQNK